MLIKAAKSIKYNGQRHRAGEIFDADSKWAEYLIRLDAAEAATEAPGEKQARENNAADPGPFDAQTTEANQVGFDDNAGDLPEVEDMTKKEIIEELTAAGVDANLKSLKDDLVQMLLEVRKDNT